MEKKRITVDTRPSPPMHNNTRTLLTTGILLGSWAMTCRCAGQTYDANAAYQTNELSGTETSPAFDVFSVGYLDRLVPDSFALFTADEHTNTFAGNADTQGFLTLNNAIVPAAAVNVSTAPFSGFSGLDAGEILLHPGGRGPDGFVAPLFDGVLRFTAPTTSFYNIAGAFRSLDIGATVNTIFRNGVPEMNIFDGGSFDLTLSLTAGDHVDFATGAGNDGIGSDSTGLRATLTLTGPPLTPPLQRVNIDFDGKRPGDEDSAGTMVGQGSAGGGNVFNSLGADSTGGDDNLTVTGANLLGDTGTATTVGFTIGPVGGDHEPGQPFEPAGIFDDYIFNNSAGNSTPGGSPFKITGLGDAATANLYLYGSFNNTPEFVIEGFPAGGIFGNYHGLNATAYLGVPVTGGEITGLFGVGETGVLGGLTVVTLATSTQFTAMTVAAGTVTLTFTTTPGLRYQAEFSDDLVLWLPLGSEQTATAGSLTRTDSAAGGGKRFYRVLVTQ